MCHRPSTKHGTMSRLPSPDSHNSLSEIPGTLQIRRSSAVNSLQLKEESQAKPKGGKERLHTAATPLSAQRVAVSPHSEDRRGRQVQNVRWTSSAGNERLVDQNSASWNWIATWLRQLDLVRASA
jgi:hypothetical protein